MKKIFKVIKEKLMAGENIVMVSVVASSGATPRGAGAHMLVGNEGRIMGTIGGGAVEYRAERIAKQVLESKTSREHDFSLTKDDVQNLGMICGGDVQIFFNYLSCENDQIIELVNKAETYFEKGKKLWLISDIAAGGKLGLYTKEDGFCGIEGNQWLKENLTRRPKRIRDQEQDYFTEQINSSGKVYVFGGGHVAQELVPVLSHVGFRCVVLEDRPEFAEKALFPDAEEILLVDFEKIDQWITVEEEDYACVMTRGHSHDTIIQAQMLKTPACYIGVIGSKHKKAGVYQVLYSMGFTPEDTDRITSPIGLTIKAETPAEIAISIAGQMIMHRAERSRT